MKVAIVGCGRISANHFSALKALPSEWSLVGVCDSDSRTMEEVSAIQGVPGFRTINDLVAATKPNVVSLCTPSGLHAEQAIESARLGCNVITEKPLATRFEHGLQMVRACDEAGVKLFVVKQNRLNRTVQLLHKSIKANRFGRLSSIVANVFWTRPQSYYDQSPWRGTWEMDGGAFMNQASHYVDLLTYMGGPLESVASFIGTLGRSIEAEDSGVMALKFRNGAMGTLNVTMLTHPQNFEGSITVLGERGTVRLGGVALNRVDAWDFAETDPTIDDEAKHASYETGSVYGFGHQSFYSEVAKALSGQPNSATTGRDGLISLATLVAAYRSAKEHKVIGLPLDL